MKRVVVTVLGLVLFPLAALADVDVKEAWVRSTLPAQKNSGAYMELVSSEASTLLSAASPVAGVVEIHSMKMEGDVMKMHSIQNLELPAGKTVKLAPGGYHIMLMELKQPLKKGEIVPITLKVMGKDKQPQNIEVKAEVRDLAQPAPMGHGHRH